MTTVNCGECGHALTEPVSTSPDLRCPCPNCGSKSRSFSVNLSESLETHDSLAYKARHGGKGKPFKEGKHGDSLHRKSGQWMQRTMTIDRENDKYFEQVVNPRTGEIIHHCEEPLRQHRGHGSAKKTDT